MATLEYIFETFKTERLYAEIYLSAKLRRGTHVWPLYILQILKMLATKNKTEYSISDLLFP